MKILIQIFISAVAALITSYILPGVEIDNHSFTGALMLAATLAILNTFLKPILVALTIPLTVFTLGLFLIVINAIIIWIADYFLNDFSVKNIWWAILFSFVLSMVTSILTRILGTNSKSN